SAPNLASAVNSGHATLPTPPTPQPLAAHATPALTSRGSTDRRYTVFLLRLIEESPCGEGAKKKRAGCANCRNSAALRACARCRGASSVGLECARRKK